MAWNKVERLAALAQKRKDAHRKNFKNLADFDRRYECDFVSPVTKSAGNIDSDILVFLQDSSSENAMNLPFEPEAARLGYSPNSPTFRNLISLLKKHFGKELADVYATNLFPLIKPGAMNSRIAPDDWMWAAKEFGRPHIEILAPLLVIVLGADSFDALSNEAEEPIRADMDDAIKAPFNFMGAYVWCQGHTGGQGTANRGGPDGVDIDWQPMASWYRDSTRTA